MKKVVLMAVVVFTILVSSAFAKKIPIAGHNQDWVKKWCGNTGVFWPEGGTSHTYGCMKPDGTGIVCDGVSPKDQQTCDTWRMVPPRLVDHFRNLSAGENKAEKQ